MGSQDSLSQRHLLRHAEHEDLTLCVVHAQCLQSLRRSALRAGAFLESEFCTLFGVDDAATVDAFELSVGDTELVLLCCRRFYRCF